MIINTTGDVPWSDGLIAFLKNCGAKYVLYTLEDCLLIRTADVSGILHTVEIMKRNKFGVVKLYNNRNLVPYIERNERVEGLIKCDSDMQFSVSYFPSLWNKDFLLSLLRAGENPWQSERAGSGRFAKAGHIPYYSDVELYPFREVIRRGKLKGSAKRFIRNIGTKPAVTQYAKYKPRPTAAARLSEVLNDAVSKIGCHYWLSAGTALGLYRGGDFIPGDTDVDIAVIGWPTIERDLASRFPDYKLFRKITHAFEIYQLALARDGVVLDVFVYSRDKYWLVNYSDRGRVTFPYNMLVHTVPIKTKYGTYNMPSPPDEYLKIKFGDDWRIPQDKKGVYESI
ncbi:MAG: LicD family protein [Gammaproteobacteria bacterium]|nr:LicD family protein [Gammaproteobacteria bacterium]